MFEELKRHKLDKSNIMQLDIGGIDFKGLMAISNKSKGFFPVVVKQLAEREDKIFEMREQGFTVESIVQIFNRQENLVGKVFDFVHSKLNELCEFLDKGFPAIGIAVMINRDRCDVRDDLSVLLENKEEIFSIVKCGVSPATFINTVTQSKVPFKSLLEGILEIKGDYIKAVNLAGNEEFNRYINFASNGSKLERLQYMIDKYKDADYEITEKKVASKNLDCAKSELQAFGSWKTALKNKPFKGVEVS